MNNPENSRLEELSLRCQRTGVPQWTSFLTPAEEQTARIVARRAGVVASSFGGYEGAERVVVCFAPDDAPRDFPVGAVRFTWPHQEAPGHRDLLGALMGLGLKRECVGDIVPEENQAWVFCLDRMAELIARDLISAGRIHLQGEVVPSLPEITPPEGEEIRDTVMSPRLDAVVGAGFHLSRGNAAELIQCGRVKLDHVPTLRTDGRVREGSVISVAGQGRLVVTEIGSPNKKGRLPIRLTRYGKTQKKGI